MIIQILLGFECNLCRVFMSCKCVKDIITNVSVSSRKENDIAVIKMPRNLNSPDNQNGLIHDLLEYE